MTRGDGREGEEGVGRERRKGEGGGGDGEERRRRGREGHREGGCRKKLLMYQSTRLELRTPI